MNLLAHAILSPSDPAILTGNVIADWVKGKARHALPAKIRLGMTLHHRIDSFTDTHHVVATAAMLLSEKWGRYSTVLADIFLDHILASTWQHHSDLPLRLFARRTYSAINAFCPLLPDRCNMAIAAMTIDDWFTSYQTPDGIRLALARMSTRLRHGIELAPAVDDFLHHRQAFQSAFDTFFPQLRTHAETFLAAEATLPA